jgi:hypothetical protein
MPGCPVRYYNGADRPCDDHDLAARATAMGLDAPPRGRHDGDNDATTTTTS